jgi:hypothetical protein
MKALLCFILGVIVGAYGLRVYERRQGPGSNRLTEWRLTPDDIRQDLARTGQVVRDRTQGVRAQISDARIVTVIKAKYVLDHNLSARDITVDAHDGIVTLGGTVPSAELLGRAVELAIDTDGVRRVVSQITLQP